MFSPRHLELRWLYLYGKRDWFFFKPTERAEHDCFVNAVDHGTIVVQSQQVQCNTVWIIGPSDKEQSLKYNTLWKKTCPRYDFQGALIVRGKKKNVLLAFGPEYEAVKKIQKLTTAERSAEKLRNPWLWILLFQVCLKPISISNWQVCLPVSPFEPSAITLHPAWNPPHCVRLQLHEPTICVYHLERAQISHQGYQTPTNRCSIIIETCRLHPERSA